MKKKKSAKAKAARNLPAKTLNAKRATQVKGGDTVKLPETYSANAQVKGGR